MKKLFMALISIAALGAVTYFAVLPRLAPAPAAPARTARVERQTIENTVNASGNLAPVTRYDLQFAAAGRVVKVSAAVGDRVVAGQELARVETGSLALDLQDAETRLALAQLQRAALNEPASADDLAVAEANLAAANAALRDLRRAVDPDQVEIARLGVERARIQLWQAQLGRPDPSLQGYIPDYQYELGNLRTDAGDLTIAQAEANYRQASQGASRADYDAARAQIAQAQAQLDRLKLGPRDADIALADAQVQSAVLAAEGARARLEKAVLTAPAAGTVAAVNVRAGDLAAPSMPGLPAFTIISADRLYLSVPVDEVDVAMLSVKQTVTITLDALADVSLPGRVAEISRVPAAASGAGASTGTTSGVVTYDVRVELLGSDPRVRAGMTANALIVTERRVGVLVVPNWAVRIDRETGQAYVPVQRAAGVEEVPVTLGLRNENVSEVLSGVDEGDLLVVLSERQGSFFTGGRP